MKPKIIALYLPQFHTIPENDEFWGKGFTDWVTVKKAKKLYVGHQQPKIPLNNNYYDLSKYENVEWQSRLAAKYGIYGFGVYHYWFNNDKNLLTKPVELMRDSDDIQTKYFLIWDNANWKRSWSNVEGNAWAPLIENKKKNINTPQILIPYILGKEKDWENHYNYVSTHFKSKNYEKLNNKPVFSIITYSEDLLEMCKYWDKLAQKEGFEGIHFIFQNRLSKNIPENMFKYSYQPHFSGWENIPFYKRVLNKINYIMHGSREMIYNYDWVWRQIIKYSSSINPNIYYGAFISYDDSPRRGIFRSKIVKGATPEKFKKYFAELYRCAALQSKEFIFLTAWNEWGEGAYLEPDTNYGYDYLNAIKEVIEESRF